MIKLELNSTDELALRHIGNALTAMASEIESEHLRVKEANFILATGDKDSVKSEHQDRRWYVEEPVGVASTEEPVKSDVTGVEPFDPKPTHPAETVMGVDTSTECETQDVIATQVNDPLDSNGLPWDGRIHSSSKAKIKDGSWRNRKGVDAETLATVEAELRALMVIPVETVTGVDTSTECETQDVIVPPAPETIVPKSQGVTPPPPPVDAVPVGCTQGDAEVVSFVEITRFITGTMVKERGWKIPEVNAKLTEQYGVTFQTLKAREDLYSTVLNFLKGQPSK